MTTNDEKVDALLERWKIYIKAIMIVNELEEQIAEEGSGEE